MPSATQGTQGFSGTGYQVWPGSLQGEYPLPAGWDHWVVCQEGLWPRQLLPSPGVFGPMGFDGSAVKGHLLMLCAWKQAKASWDLVSCQASRPCPAAFPLCCSFLWVPA